MISLEDVRSCGYDSQELVDALNVGITAKELDELLGRLLNEESEVARAVARMNLIGGLRMKYDISGGRRGGKVYQFLGLKEVVERETIEDWSDSDLMFLEELQSLPEVSESVIEAEQSRRSDNVHENCTLYPIAYEGARRQLRLLQEGPNSAILIQKFRYRPVWYIFELFAHPEWLLSWAERLAPYSYRPVKVINIRQESLAEINVPSSTVWPRVEAVYSTEAIALSPGDFLNKRALTTLRARLRDTLFLREGEMSIEEHRQVIKTWKQLNEKKHRSLAITRDFIALDTPNHKRRLFGGKRDGIPVAHHLFSISNVDPQTACLMNDKALVYPPGKYGLADWNLFTASRALFDEGILFINSGGIDGGGVGLPHKKKKFAVDFVKSFTLVTDFPHRDQS